MKKDADPRRQLGQYRRMIATQKMWIWWSTLFWLAPLILLVLTYETDVHRAMKVFLGIALFSGVMQQINEVARFNDYKRKEQALHDKAASVAESDVRADGPTPGGPAA